MVPVCMWKWRWWDGIRTSEECVCGKVCVHICIGTFMYVGILYIGELCAEEA